VFRPRRSAATLAVALLACLATGCIAKTPDGDKTVYRFETWIACLPLVAGLALVAIGWFTRKNKPWAAYVMIVLGPIIAAIGFPMMRADQTVVDGEHFESSHGLPWDRVTHNVRYADLRGVRVSYTTTRRRGVENKSYTMSCLKKSGGEEKVPVGNVMEAAMPQILGLMHKQDVPIEYQEGVPQEWVQDLGPGK
jgi:hypothetical protein